MSDIEIKAKKVIGDETKDAIIFYDFGDNLDEALEKFDKNVIFTNFRASAKITAQAAMRRYLEAGKDAEAIVELMKSWKPGVALERKSDPVAAFKAKFAAMSEEEKIKALAELKATLEAGDADSEDPGLEDVA
jgi:hypothetical protein